MGHLPLEELRQKIRDAFPPQVFYGVVTTCPCEECVEISQGLRFKSWDQIPVEFLDFTCCPALLSTEAFLAFLPAYLVRGLEHEIVAELTVYCLCPNPEPDVPAINTQIEEQAALMNSEQIEAIRSFLVYVVASLADSLLRDFIELGLSTVWNRPAKRTRE